jgi:transcriptional regulator with XRE-family HTH domain
MTVAELASLMRVDKSAVNKWEADVNQPKDGRLKGLADALGTEIDDLLAIVEPRTAEQADARLIHTYTELPILLTRLAASCNRVKALRLSAPYATGKNVQTAFRKTIGARIRDGSVEFQRLEIFYGLDRVKEVISNVFLYDGCSYIIKGCAVNVSETLPGIGAYIFDDYKILLGGYWSSIPPDEDTPNLFLEGELFSKFYSKYWAEIWRRYRFLNIKGADDLLGLRAIAIELGLDAAAWQDFVEEARNFSMGDGAPPLP